MPVAVDLRTCTCPMMATPSSDPAEVQESTVEGAGTSTSIEDRVARAVGLSLQDALAPLLQRLASIPAAVDQRTRDRTPHPPAAAVCRRVPVSSTKIIRRAATKEQVAVV